MKLNNTEKECIKLLRVMKGHELTDGGVLAGFTLTITDRKTKEQKIIKI